VPRVRLIALDGSQVGIVATPDALRQAQELGYDLVEVAAQSNPPVCRIMDFGKYIYALRKKDRENRKKQKTQDVKEVKFSVKIFEHDYQTKLQHCKEFLERGDKVKATMFLRGREMTRADHGLQMMKRLTGDLAEYGVVEKNDGLDGNIISLMFAPKSSKTSPPKGRNGDDGQENQTQDEQSGQETL
jgi:translation initiation factor IF-3